MLGLRGLVTPPGEGIPRAAHVRGTIHFIVAARGHGNGLVRDLGYEVNLVDSKKSTDCAVAPGCVQNVRWLEFGKSSSVNPPPATTSVDQGMKTNSAANTPYDLSDVVN